MLKISKVARHTTIHMSACGRGLEANCGIYYKHV